MKTMIAVPCMDTVQVGFTESLLNITKPEGTRVCFKANSLVYDSRNLLSLTAREHQFDRVLWLDSDMIVPPDALTTLSNDMDELGAEMVTGLYVTRFFPIKPVIYDHLEEPGRDKNGNLTSRLSTMTEYPRNDVFRVAACGFGCVMTSTKLLKQVWDKFGPAFHPFMWCGEDIAFCYRVQMLGVPIYCDSRVSCGHTGMVTLTEAHLPGKKEG